MNGYIKMLVLSYFKCVGTEYSLGDLHDLIGVSMFKLNSIIDELYSDKLLIYNNENLLSLSLEGRLTLGQTSVENYDFFVKGDKLSEEADGGIDNYVDYVDGFSNRRWRGSI